MEKYRAKKNKYFVIFLLFLAIYLSNHIFTSRFQSTYFLLLNKIIKLITLQKHVEFLRICVNRDFKGYAKRYVHKIGKYSKPWLNKRIGLALVYNYVILFTLSLISN